MVQQSIGIRFAHKSKSCYEAGLVETFEEASETGISAKSNKHQTESEFESLQELQP